MANVYVRRSSIVRDVVSDVPKTDAERAWFKGQATWGVYSRDDGPLPLFVTRTRTGLTVVDCDGKMQTCWHTGISAGNLARNVVSRQAARTGG